MRCGLSRGAVSLAISEMEHAFRWLKHHALQRAAPLLDLVELLEDPLHIQCRAVLGLKWDELLVPPTFVIDTKGLRAEVVGAAADAILLTADLQMRRRDFKNHSARFVADGQAARGCPRDRPKRFFGLRDRGDIPPKRGETP